MIREMIVARGKTARKPKKPKHRRAFWVVPVKLNSKVKEHAHVLGQAGVPPCPIGAVYAGRIAVGNISFCLYIDREGAEFMIQC